MANVQMKYFHILDLKKIAWYTSDIQDDHSSILLKKHKYVTNDLLQLQANMNLVFNLQITIINTAVKGIT